MTRVLFLDSPGFLWRSRMAQAFADSRRNADTEAASACVGGDGMPPLAARVMAEVGMALPTDGPLDILADGVALPEFTVVVLLSEDAARKCPMLPGDPIRVNWLLPTPHAVVGDDESVTAYLRQSRDEMRRLVGDFIDRGYLRALASARNAADGILNRVTDGILAHDLDRRIFYFNKAAERITEFPQSEVINRDCHAVFPGNFCGAQCDFCDGKGVPGADQHREIKIVTRSGETRTVDAFVSPLIDAFERVTGVMVSFHDITQERRLARRVGDIHQFSGIVGRDTRMLELFDLIHDLADSNVPVFIRGESGTGKELIAAAIHNEGPRANRMFVPVNCGALPESLLESELFGHVKGAFTGAFRDKKGRFELADGGTIFLDEVGDISPAMQVKLLRVLQEGTFERVGGEVTQSVNVRVISASNKDIEDEIHAGRFREDLYYRLNVVPVHIAPLRERRTDIPLLVDYILARALKDIGRTGVTVAPEALDAMLTYDWPGNVRELQNWIQFALVKCRGPAIRPEHLPPRPANQERSRPWPPPRGKLSADAVREALRQSGGSKVAAARLLAVSRATLYRFLAAVGERP
jgi:PAS domain S-box-containing protein